MPETTVLVTGSRGFIGRNLLVGLQRTKNVAVKTFDRGEPIGKLEEALAESDFIFHLAGVNRPKDEKEFEEVNAGLTKDVIAILEKAKKRPAIVFASSYQAALDNSYGKSKKAAEDALIAFSRRTGARVFIFRLPGVFGKWSRPNYNTVVATFCHNIAQGMDITISDRQKEIVLVYIDVLVDKFLRLLDAREDECGFFCDIDKAYRISLGELADKIYELKNMRDTLVVPDLSDEFMRCLYATYLSFLDEKKFSYPLDVKSDARGSLFELIKSKHFGQIFLSTSRKGILRGNHYHDSKIEKFCVIKGKALIRFRHILSNEVISYPVSDEKMEIVDIPPGYTHSIENLSDGEMILLVWANQIFDPQLPDTHSCEVQHEKD
jgi:UDP-2-acetamido-2,6-beta-L-arabino-hexul-4-ose reductase